MTRDVRVWLGLVVGLTLASACRFGAATFPSGSGVAHVAATHADVRTLNEGYQRSRSQVLVREVTRATRAAMDYAAYHANFMIADLEPEGAPPSQGTADTSNPFAGGLDKGTLTGDVQKTPLTEQERDHPMAFAPLVGFLQARKIQGADGLEELGSAVRSEGWRLGRSATSPQQISEVFLHVPPQGPAELWAKVEFAPWFKALNDLPDQDGDGFPEIYGRVRSGLATAPVVEALQHDYLERVLTPAEIKAWANQLASYWYPSFNTDLIPPGAAWPDDRTEADIRRELGGKVFSAPTLVLRGKPQGKATYELFLVKAGTTNTASPIAAPVAGVGATLKLAKTKPTPEVGIIANTVKRELATEGNGSWTTWAAKLAPFHAAVRQRLQSSPPKSKGLAGAHGFLFYRNSLEFVVGGDLEAQAKGKNPLPIIVEFKDQLKAEGVDFLFVPVPTKEEVYPDEVDPKFKALAGQIVNPYARKLLLDLTAQGVEVVDLLTPFLEARRGSDQASHETLFQHQDTHWTDRGLRLAADIVAARVKKYPWYSEIAAHAQTFGQRDANFTRFGDLQSRLPEAEKKRYQPETLVAHQVIRTDGTPYDDDPDSPIVVLGDSFTGVYELTDAEHAGISAHLARGVSWPVDLVMSYGGGPNVRQKLMRRGPSALTRKKLVVWMMTARDLYNYWESWESLKIP